MNEAFLIDGVRSPIGKFTGSLSPIRTDDLAAHAIDQKGFVHIESIFVWI
jgi:acetyl-CoA acetyltransferase